MHTKINVVNYILGKELINIDIKLYIKKSKQLGVIGTKKKKRLCQCYDHYWPMTFDWWLESFCTKINIEPNKISILGAQIFISIYFFGKIFTFICELQKKGN